MRKKENRESIQKGKDGKESRKTYKKVCWQQVSWL